MIAYPWGSEITALVDPTAAELATIYLAGYREQATARLGVGAFDLPNDRAAEWAARRAGQLVTGVEQTTRDRIGALVAAAMADPDVSEADLARQIRAEFADMSAARAELIARNETHMAAANGDIAAFRDTGVTAVQISDGVDFDEPCREANGAIWSLDRYAANPMEHPNCSRVGSALEPGTYDPTEVEQ